MDCADSRTAGGETEEVGSATIKEIFFQAYPFYRHIGMSSREYWDEEPALAQYFLRHYRNTQREEFEEKNFNNWLQGLYNYNALSVALSQLFDSKNEDIQYPDKPINFFETEEEKKARIREERLKEVERFMDNI